MPVVLEFLEETSGVNNASPPASQPVYPVRLIIVYFSSRGERIQLKTQQYEFLVMVLKPIERKTIRIIVQVLYVKCARARARVQSAHRHVQPGDSSV